MTLLALLTELRTRSLRIHVREGGKALVRGEGESKDLKAALVEHKPSLVRLYRERTVGWHASLLEATPEEQEMWLLKAQGMDPESSPRGAEFLAAGEMGWT